MSKVEVRRGSLNIEGELQVQSMCSRAASDSQLSIVCSVFSKDPMRWQRIEDHAENLSNQTVPVVPIYILEEGEKCPVSLDATVVSVNCRLSIYQAWFLGFSLAETEFVGNLNLDDRFLATGCENLINLLIADKADLVGGEWNVLFDQQAVDHATKINQEEALPFSPEWPPANMTPTRLGSGDGSRFTFGPATIWNRHVLYELGFPCEFGNSIPIESIGDGLFWQRLVKANKNLVRTTAVVGRYLSRPSEQAEFREHDDIENFESGVRFFIPSNAY